MAHNETPTKENSMKKIDIAKNLVSLIVGAGTSKIVSAIVSNNTNPESVIDKVTVTSGSLVLGAMVADLSKQYTDAKIDRIVELVNENRQKN